MVSIKNRGVRLKSAFILLTSLLLSIFGSSESTVIRTNTLKICEGNTARLECPGESEQIAVELANFGRFSLHVCNDNLNTEFSTSCANNATFPILATKCNGHQLCEFVVSSTMFGDLCPGTSKYLEAKYNCLYAPTTVAPSAKDGINSLAPAESQNDQHVKYEIENEKPKEEGCPDVFYRLLQWPFTRPNQLAEVLCPLGSTGRAQRMCLENAKWSVEADLSGCVSSVFQSFLSEVKQMLDSGLFIHSELVDDIRRHVRVDKLLGGDLIQLADLLYKINVHNIRFTNEHNERLLEDVMTTEIVNEVLQMSQREAWLDLLPDKQTQIAQRLLFVVEQSLRNAVRGVSSPRIMPYMHVARPSVVGVVALARKNSKIELPSTSSYDIEDQILFSLPDSNLNQEYEIAYSSIANLGQFLMRSKASQSTCNRILMSKVLSAWTETRSFDRNTEKVPLILSFLTRKSDVSSRVQCTRWSESQEDFVEDGSCMVLVHNSSHTICRCLGSGHYAVLSSTCDAQIFPGFNKETIAFFSSCLLAVFGIFVYLFGMSLVKQNQPQYAFIRRNFCVHLILAEFIICIWFLLPRQGLWASLFLYFLHGMLFTALWWILIQMFQLFYSLIQLIGQRNIGTNFPHYIIGYAIPLVFMTILIGFSRNFKLFLQGFQPLQAPDNHFITGPLVLLMFFHFLFGLLTWYLLNKQFKVGYTPCRIDAETLTAVRKSLLHLAPLIIVIDICCLVMVRFSINPTSVWLWILVLVNVIESIMALRVLSFKRVISGKFFCEEKNQMRANDLPKNPIFSPAVQNNLPPGFSFPYTDQSYSKTRGSSLGSFGMESQQPIYIARNGIHAPHECDCQYASIPTEYYSFYNNQNYRIYHQNPANPSQLQYLTRPPVPPIPVEGFSRINEHPGIFTPHPIVEEIPQMAVCHEHGFRCNSLALRLSNSQLHQPHQMLSSDGGSYETARSSSTTGTTSSIASSGTFLLRIDPKQSSPVIFLDDNS